MSKASPKLAIVHNVISPYKTVLFNQLKTAWPNLAVLYFAPTEKMRDWRVDREDITYEHQVLFEKPLDDIGPWALFKAVWKALDDVNPDIVLVCEYIKTGYWAALFWAMKNRKKRIFWTETTAEDRPRIWIKEQVKRWFIRQFQAGLAQSSKSKRYMHELGMPYDHIWVKGYVTDNDFYATAYAKERENRDALQAKYDMPKHNFLFVGRLAKEKNLLFLLSAFKKARDHGCDWGLILVGDGPMRRILEAYVLNCKLEKVVHFAGFVQKEGLAPFQAMSDVFVLPSVSEPWGLVVNEAMACGLPVLVSTRCGCFPDIVRDRENGFSFDPTDEHELVDLMFKLSDGRYNLAEMGKASIEIMTQFTPQTSVAVMKTVLDAVATMPELA